MEFYLDGGAENDFYKRREAGVGKGVGRLDSIGYALEELKEDFPTLMLGFGAGNVIPGPFETFEGAYVQKYAIYGVKKSTVTNLLWETGLLGVALSVFFLMFVWRDAKVMASSNKGLASVLAVGWVGVVSVLAVSLVYKNIIHQNVVMILVLILSGYIAAKRQEIKNQAKVIVQENIKGTHRG